MQCCRDVIQIYKKGGFSKVIISELFLLSDVHWYYNGEWLCTYPLVIIRYSMGEHMGHYKGTLSNVKVCLAACNSPI